MNTPPPPSVTNTDALKAHQRLCHVIKRCNFDGYGFNLHSEKGKPGQYIGKIDDDSPAEAAGLRESDRIIEVNSVNIGTETHKQVVQRIKAMSNEVQLLVIDPIKEKEILQSHKTVLNATATTTKSVVLEQPEPRDILSSSTITIKSTTTSSLSTKENNKVAMSTFAKPVQQMVPLSSSSSSSDQEALSPDSTAVYENQVTTIESASTSAITKNNNKESDHLIDTEKCLSILVDDDIDQKLNSNPNMIMLNDINNHNHNNHEIRSNNENLSSSINNIQLNNNNLNKNHNNYHNQHHNNNHQDNNSTTTITALTKDNSDQCSSPTLSNNHYNVSSSTTTTPPPPYKNNNLSNKIKRDDIKEITKDFQKQTVSAEEKNNHEQQQQPNNSYDKVDNHSQSTLLKEHENMQPHNNRDDSLLVGQKGLPLLNLPMTAAEMRAKLLAKKKYDPKSDSVDLRKKFEIIQKL